MKKVMITQSNYIPWKGYFDSIRLVDEFVLYDDMQFTKRDWRNRNMIKTPQGTLWLTIPVEVKGKYFQKIRDTKISDPNWRTDHWKSIAFNYSKAKHFKDYKDLFEELYLKRADSLYLSEVNFLFLTEIIKLLDIKTPIRWSSDFELAEGKTERLVDLCQKLEATDYYSGPAAKDYIVEDQFKSAGVNLHFLDFSKYEPYTQLYGEFTHAVSVIDLIFNEGPRAREYLRDLG